MWRIGKSSTVDDLVGEHSLRVHDFLPHSRANGPGVRAVVWVQGCTLGCPGCFNPETHSQEGGYLVRVDDLADRIVALARAGGVEGVSVSGGEPLQQRGALLALLHRVRRETALSVVLFTGYTRAEIEGMAEADELLDSVDVLVAGRYDVTRRIAAPLDLRGSANQSVELLTGRYTLEDLRRVPPAEVIITPQGEAVVSGVDGINW